MSENHTPGPWETRHRKGADSMYRTEVFSDQHGGIATCEWTVKHCGNGVEKTYRAANARLIAAAPELLDELAYLIEVAEGAMRESNRDGGEYDIAEMLKGPRAVISKATGTKA